MCQHQPGVQANWHRARDNSKYVRALLSERQPEFFTILQSAERQIEFELSGESHDWRARISRAETDLVRYLLGEPSGPFEKAG
jgi:hypothetical protein